MAAEDEAAADISGPRRSEYWGGSSTNPSWFGGGNSSSTSVWMINRDGVYVDMPAMAALRCVVDIESRAEERSVRSKGSIIAGGGSWAREYGLKGSGSEVGERW